MTRTLEETHEPVGTPPTSKWRLTKKQTIVLVLVASAYLVTYMNRQIFPLLLPAITEEIAMSDTQVGVLTGFASVALNIAAALGVVALAGRVTNSSFVKLSMVVLVLMPLLAGGSFSFWPLFIALLGIGMAEATVSAPSLSILADHFHGSKRVFANSGYTIGLIGGMVFAYYVIGDLAVAYGWRAGFFAASGITLIIGLAIFLLLPKSETPAEEERESLGLRSLGAIFRIKSARWILIGTFFQVVLTDSAFQWLPLYLSRSLEMSDSRIAWLMGTNYIVLGTLGILVGGAVAIRLRTHSTRRMQWMNLSVVALTLVGYLAMLFTSSQQVSLVGVSLTILLGMAAYGSVLSFSQDVTPTSLHTQVVAVMFVLMGIGQGLGSFTIGAISDRLSDGLGVDSLRTAMLVVVLVAGAATLICFTLAALNGNRDTERAQRLDAERASA
ncbi:MFS transporter [Leucobacter tenebrionis]|uniref:MFS transporter n=1 Tax=Leucobacter tenebrionis TaxID=2873270 RepID=UPI001CA63CB5|nr:MFS transporter [Leucobacter tenebrionis]QZY51018.1 MFS transporter [Leucobacter tenebrionis]